MGPRACPSALRGVQLNRMGAVGTVPRSPETEVAPRESATDLQPISLMSRSISVRIRLQGTLDAGLSGSGQREKIVAAEADRLGAQREGLQHMRAALDAAVDQHIDLVADGVDDLGQLIEGAARAVQLPAAMIGDDDAAAADVDGLLGVRERS